MAYQAQVAKWKKDVVSNYEKLMSEYPIVGAVNVESLPARQLQNMRETLRGTVVIKMAKRRFLNIALKSASKNAQGLDQLSDHLRGMPALLFTKENPFRLFKQLKENKSKAPAKAGQIAPNDIVIPKGKTPFAPGPVIGELGALGVKTGVDGGKVAVQEDTVVAKEGDEISQELAAMLTRMDINPMEVGLDLTAVYEDGSILPKNVLDIDEDAILQSFKDAASSAFHLAVGLSFPTKETVELLIGNCARDARALAIEQGVLTKDTADVILGKAHGQMLAVAGTLPDEALSDELKGAKTQAAAAPAAAPASEGGDEKKDDNQEEKKDDDKADEGEAAAGLGALFG